jgi:oligopeptide transport system substrate-binding protein
MGDDGVTPEPGAAASWDVSDDGLTYTFHLRKDARWSNGDPVVAEDFVAGWFRALMPDTGGDYAALLWDIDGARAFRESRSRWLDKSVAANRDVSRNQALTIWRAERERFEEQVGVRAIDATTLQVRLAEPTPYFPYVVSMPVFAPLPHQLPEQHYRTAWYGRVMINPELFASPDQLLCNGPYQLEQVIEDREVALVANEHYWGAADVRTALVVQRAFADTQKVIEAYDAGQVHWIPSVHEGGDALLDSGREDVHLVEHPGTYYYQFNCREMVLGKPNPFARREVRRALARTFDRDALAELAGRGARPLDTFVPPGIMPGYEPPDRSAATFDMETAEREIAEAVFDDAQGPLRILINSSPGHEPIAAAVAAKWGALGVVAQVQSVDFQDYIERSKRGDFHARRAGWIGDYQDPTTFLDMLVTDSPNNDAGYSNEVFDGLMEQASAELDAERRLTLMREAEAILLEDAVVVPIYRYAGVSIFDPGKVSVPLNGWLVYRLEHLHFVDD